MKTGIILLAIVALLLCILLFFRTCSPNATPPEPAIQRDTVVIRDTLRPSVPKPEVITVVRYDTIRLQIRPVEDITTTRTTIAIPEDTIPQITSENDVIIPITRNTYKTEDYTAVVEGYKPRLASIELYPKTTTITNTITKTRSPRWALTVGPGVGYGPNGVQPYIGVTVGFVLQLKQ
jgi:hypothetical protein